MPKRASNPDDDRTITISELPLVALRETVIFPEMIVPLQVGREKSVAALNAAVEQGGAIALVTQRQPEQEEIVAPDELYPVGTLAKIAQVVQLPDGTVRAIVQGQGRLRVHGFTQTDPYLSADIEELTDKEPAGVEIQALMRTVQAQIEQYVANGAPVPPEAAVALAAASRAPSRVPSSYRRSRILVPRRSSSSNRIRMPARLTPRSRVRWRIHVSRRMSFSL